MRWWRFSSAPIAAVISPVASMSSVNSRSRSGHSRKSQVTIGLLLVHAMGPDDSGLPRLCVAIAAERPNPAGSPPNEPPAGSSPPDHTPEAILNRPKERNQPSMSAGVPSDQMDFLNKGTREGD